MKAPSLSTLIVGRKASAATLDIRGDGLFLELSNGAMQLICRPVPAGLEVVLHDLTFNKMTVARLTGPDELEWFGDDLAGRTAELAEHNQRVVSAFFAYQFARVDAEYEELAQFEAAQQAQDAPAGTAGEQVTS